MNKNDMIAKVAGDLGYTKKDVTAVVDKVCEVIANAVASGDTVKIAGFGTFSVSERSERQGRNPQTGETITIAASKSPKFKAAKAFKDVVNA